MCDHVMCIRICVKKSCAGLVSGSHTIITLKSYNCTVVDERDTFSILIILTSYSHLTQQRCLCVKIFTLPRDLFRISYTTYGVDVHGILDFVIYFYMNLHFVVQYMHVTLILNIGSFLLTHNKRNYLVLTLFLGIFCVFMCTQVIS